MRQPDEEPFQPSTAVLYVPGASRSFFVRAPGTLDNGEWSTCFRTACDGEQDSSLTSVRYVTAGVPVVVIERQTHFVRFELSFVLVTDSTLSAPAASVRILARNIDRRIHLVGISSEFATERGGLGFVAPDAPEGVRVAPRWAGRNDEGPAHGWFAHDEPRLAEWAWSLAPGESASVRFIIPAYAESESTLRRLAESSHLLAIQLAEVRWSAILDTGMFIGVADKKVVSAFRSAVSVLLGCTQARAGRVIPIGNPLQYRDLWLRDGSRCAAALAMAGHIELARRMVLGFLAYQWPQGPFLSQRGQLDGTGHVLWAMGQTHLRPRPSSELRELTDSGLAAWRWAEAERVATQLLGMPFGGLLPPSEPRDNELPSGSGQLVGVDAWTIAGYEALTRLLDADGNPTMAKLVRQSRERYVARFRRALDATGSSGVPPTWLGTGENWGNLSVAYPCGVLPATDPRLAVTLERVRDGSPIPGLVRYGAHDTVHTYLSVDVAQTELLRGHPENTLETLQALVRWRTASGGSPEMFAADSLSFGQNFPPHATAAAGLVALVRNMLLFDDGDTLYLTLGAPLPWWSKGSVRRAPTRWGELSLDFERRGDRFSWHWTPVGVPTALCLPAGYLPAAGFPGRVALVGTRACIIVPPHVSRLDVSAKHRRGSP